MTSLGWTLNSSSNLAFTGILFLFFLMKTILFFYSLGNQHSAATISRGVLSVLFAVPQICCTCCLDEQRDICPSSLVSIWLHFKKTLQKAGSRLFVGRSAVGLRRASPSQLALGQGPIKSLEPAFWRVFWMNLSSVRKWPIPTRWPEVRKYNGGWSVSCSQSISLFFVNRSRIDVIKLCSLSLWTTH